MFACLYNRLVLKGHGKNLVIYFTSLKFFAAFLVSKLVEFIAVFSFVYVFIMQALNIKKHTIPIKNLRKMC